MPITVVYELVPDDPESPHGPCKVRRDGKVIARHTRAAAGIDRMARRVHLEALRLAQGDSVVMRQPGDNPGVVREVLITPDLARKRARNLEDICRRAMGLTRRGDEDEERAG